MSEHTKTPWHVGNHPNDDSGLNWREILTNALEFSPSYVGQMQKEDAEFTVRAVNSHDALVAALKAAQATLYSMPAMPRLDNLFLNRRDEANTQINAALKLADSKN